MKGGLLWGFYADLGYHVPECLPGDGSSSFLTWRLQGPLSAIVSCFSGITDNHCLPVMELEPETDVFKILKYVFFSINLFLF